MVRHNCQLVLKPGRVTHTHTLVFKPFTKSGIKGTNEHTSALAHHPEFLIQAKMKNKKGKRSTFPIQPRPLDSHLPHIIYHYKSFSYFMAPSIGMTAEVLYFVILNEGQDRLDWHQAVELSDGYHATMFEKNWIVCVQMQVNSKSTILKSHEYGSLL